MQVEVFWECLWEWQNEAWKVQEKKTLQSDSNRSSTFWRACKRLFLVQPMVLRRHPMDPAHCALARQKGIFISQSDWGSQTQSSPSFVERHFLLLPIHGLPGKKLPGGPQHYHSVRFDVGCRRSLLFSKLFFRQRKIRLISPAKKRCEQAQWPL